MNRFEKTKGISALLERLPKFGMALVIGAAIVSCSTTDNAVTAPKIVAGAAHACAFDADREQVVCWGDNSYGQLGNEEFSAEGVSAPVRVKAISGREIKSLSAGYSHTCALLKNGDDDTKNTVACWGYNHYGQVGNGTNQDVNVPVFVNGPDGNPLKGVQTLSAGAYHTCASMAKGAANEGKVFCWGRNDKGQIGNGSLVNVNVPTLVDGLEYGGGVAAGTAHTCALTAKSIDDAQASKYQVVCWGDASHGQMREAKVAGGYSTKPVEIGMPLEGADAALFSEHVVQADVTTATNKPAKGEPAVAVETPAYGQTCAITKDQILCWGGTNQNGQWGTDEQGAKDHTVTASEIVDGSTLRAYGAGNAQSCMLVGKGDDASANEVACWGYSSSLGFAMPEDATDAVVASNRQTVTLSGTRPTGLAVGREFVCYAAKGDQPQIWCWGTGKKGQIGNGNVEGTRVPQCVKGYCPDTKKDENLVEGQPFEDAPDPIPGVVQIEAGVFNTCAVMTDWSARCWGLLEIHIEPFISRNEDLPTVVDDLVTPIGFVQNSVSEYCALTFDNSVVCWGRSTLGWSNKALEYSEYYSPRVLPGYEGNVKSIAMSREGLCALMKDTSVKCRLASFTSTTLQEFTFPKVANASSISLLNTPFRGPCVLAGGSVKCVKDPGNPTYTTLAGFEANVSMFDAMEGHYCGAFSNGTVKCDQYTEYSSLEGGEAGTVDNLPPIQSLHVGLYHACVVTKSGGVRCWGDGSSGQLGDGKAKTSASPVEVQGLQSGVVGLSAGGFHTCAVLLGGMAKCWGDNLLGQLGNGSNRNTSDVPVLVDFGGKYGPRKAATDGEHLQEGQAKQKVTVTLNTLTGDIGYGFDCDGDGSFEINGDVAGHECFYSKLPSGGYNIGYKVTTKGLFGNAEVTGATSFVVENLPPVITSVQHDTAVVPAGSNAAKAFTVTSVLASDPGRDALIYSYDCNMDGTIFGIAEENKGASNASCDLSTLTPGIYTLAVVVTDADNITQGNGRTTKPITITIVPALSTQIDTKPAAYAGATATFTFSSAETNTIETKLDSAAYLVTTLGTRSFTALTDGTHTFFARSVSDGNADATPASYSWIVDTIAPLTVSDTTFTQPVGTDSVNISFHATDANLTGITFQCQLDSGAFGSCTSGQSIGPVAEGSHSVTVKATDAAGNPTTSPATISWSYWAPPETTLDSSGPSGTVSQTSGTFTFTSPTATGFECKLDTGAWTVCTSPYSTPTLGNGSHTVQVRAVRNGVPDATVATRTWTVDTSAAPLAPVTGSTLAAGPSHACAVANGKMYCWGSNGSGQLGDGTSNTGTTPVQIGAATDWASVSAGSGHTCALRTSGALYCWGGNGYGQLGTQDPAYYFGSSSPVTVTPVYTWHKVAAIDQHTCAVRSDQSLWCWGTNGNGELGLGYASGFESNYAVTIPTQVGSNTNWVDVDGGYGFTCALNASGAMYCWGDGSMDQLGVGSTAGFFSPMTAAATNVAAMTAGAQHACAAKKDGTLWCWGQNTTFQGGNSVSDRTLPSQVGTATDWSSGDAGVIHTCAIKTDGTLWCWGDQTNNALGNGLDTGMQMTPLQIGIQTDWSAVSCNNGSPGVTGGYCIGMRNTAGNDVYSWGDNSSSQCGTDGGLTPVVAPAGTDYMLQLTPFP